MGLLEKRRCKNFFVFVQNYDENVPKTHEGLFFFFLIMFFIIKKGMNLNKEPFKVVLKKFDLQSNTIDFIGHAVALYTSDDYLEKPAIDTINKIKLYMNSVGLYGDSPFIYPVYGLGGIPEGFSRMCAIYGGI